MTRDEVTAPEIVVRDAGEADMLTVQGIYAHYVLSSLATFEETPPSLEVMLARRRACLDNGLPYLVAVADGEVVGFAYAGAYHARPAYRFTIEDSVYVADGMRGRGVGSSAAYASSSNAAKPARGGRWSQSSATATTPARSVCTGGSGSSSRAS